MKLCRGVLLFVVIISAINARGQGHTRPGGLRVDLLLHTGTVWKNGFEVRCSLSQADKERSVYQVARITSAAPCFSWVVNSDAPRTYQAAYQVLVASDARKLEQGRGDLWNSGRVISGRQLGVRYGGKALAPGTVYYWKVKTWDNRGGSSEFSEPSSFLTDSVLESYQTPYTPLVKTVQPPAGRQELPGGNTFLDFGKDAFGQFGLIVKTAGDKDTLRIYIGEAIGKSGHVDPRPKGTVRYRLLLLPLQKGEHYYCPVITPDKTNTGPRAIHMPGYIGEVMPFRYVEIAHGPDVTVTRAERYAVNYIFNDTATRFESSDTVLNKVWDLCKYTMKATSFTGLYIDGDRERTPYEADALINQRSHYATDAEYNMAKRSLDYLVYHATWPTEWSLQNLLIAWNDYWYSGDLRNIEGLYAALKAKTLTALSRPDGLISTRTGRQDSAFAKAIHLVDFGGKTVLRDIVDWPQKGGVGLPPDATGETDNFVFTDYNSVVNAFHYASLVCMKNIAHALGKNKDADDYDRRAAGVKEAFRHCFLDPATGLVKDGEGTMHSSLHANMMALAFGLVPEQNKSRVLSFIRSRGMACSVYGAQFLLDAVYDAGDAGYGLKLLTSTGKRSWYNMIRAGATMTTEAWDTEFKGNQDWGHAWGSAPANIIVEKLMGVTPLTPAFGTIQIKPRPGTLDSASLELATLRGSIAVAFEQYAQSFRLKTRMPVNTQGVVYLPRQAASDRIYRNGKMITALPQGDFWKIGHVEPGADSWQVDYASPRGKGRIGN